MLTSYMTSLGFLGPASSYVLMVVEIMCIIGRHLSHSSICWEYTPFFLFHLVRVSVIVKLSGKKVSKYKYVVINLN